MLYQILIFTIHRKTKKSYNNNRFKISALTWNDKFELPDGSYSISNIQDYFEYILKNIVVILIIPQYTFKIKTRYYIEL